VGRINAKFEKQIVDPQIRREIGDAIDGRIETCAYHAPNPSLPNDITELYYSAPGG
jgi:hypothetical protein